MIIPICADCPHGGIREGKSHCAKEKCYSYLTKCVADRALREYLERVAVEQMVVNQ